MIRRALPLLASLALAACAAQKAPDAPPPAPAAPPEPTSISLTQQERDAIAAALKDMGAKPVDTPVAWATPAASGSVKVLRDGFDIQNRPCREFHSLVVQGKLYQHSTAFLCRQPDGAWEVVQAREYPTYRHDKSVPGSRPTPVSAAPAS
ncbi:hypothetical protein HHL28_12045 [Aerophototrophica crusticola]|uniref:Surface antigen domain-containing protein n=1 Tax=Aerophototrophica crusticola TaxID=1709002 RepID=A0A858R994_9PROT|nr:hypothetical protein HHL28_12045 [Rhodospirillaceae bacterium B3]